MKRAVAIAAAWMALASPAQGACVGGTCSCTVSAEGPAFGTYDSLRRTTVTGVGTVSVTCRADTQTEVSYDISLSAGGSGDPTARLMTAGSASLRYNLYTTPAYADVWGDGRGATSTVGGYYVATKSGPERHDHAIYGLIEAGQFAAPGSYQDAIVVTVTY